MRACPPAIKGQPAATMTIISTLQLVPPHASKTNGNSDSSPFTPDNIHHKRKKTKTFGLVSFRRTPGRVARCVRNAAL